MKKLITKLHTVLMWLCGVEAATDATYTEKKEDGKDSEALEHKSNCDNNGKCKSKNNKAPLVVRGLLGAALALGIPFLVAQGLPFLRQAKLSYEPVLSCKAEHDFVAINEGELSFKRGDTLILLDPKAVPGQNGWASAMTPTERHKGLAPLNYLTL